ncbi:venom acid phosphatase Acph-1-like isoform X2 [Hyposmocoma kahamanoa]|nr:venom acid phosphatase Acph-1-like isoform X2 [Hyposmocoma kahamanoa]
MPSPNVNWTEVLFPYGMKALTNKGKQRGYYVGKYLRSRYNGFISSMYLPDEIEVRTTDFARTKMTALTLLAALYHPPPAQRWHSNLNWQPVPYNTLPHDEDDLLYWYNCPRYLWLRNKVYKEPEVKLRIKPYQALFTELGRRTGTNITTPEDVFYLDNLFQALENVGYPPPLWAQELMPQIKEMTKIEYAIENYNAEMIRLSAGVLMTEILNASNATVRGEAVEPKLRLYSAHENNVAAIMAAVRVFEPHQPRYGSTFSLELRLHRHTGQYGMAAVYSPTAGGPTKILPIAGCGGGEICDYEVFLAITQEAVLSKEQFNKECPVIN